MQFIVPGKLQQIVPAKARPFIIKALALVIGWNLLYHLLLSPLGIPDTQLTAAVQYGTAKILSVFYADVAQHGPSIFINGVQSINIAPQCNGLELIVLYLGFILCIPSDIRKTILFALAGIAGIYILNILRCSLLGWMYYADYSIADFAHHYAFKMVVYAAVFYGWVLYTRKPKLVASEA